MTNARIPKGYTLKPRIIYDSWIAHAPPVVRETWMYLIDFANHSQAKYNGFQLERGQRFVRLSDVREALHWMVGYRKNTYSVNQMKHSMKVLRREGMITTTNHPRGMVVTICNYNKYQSPANYESTNESTNESTIDQPSINQSSPSINKNEKKNKELKKENKYTESDLQSASFMFDRIKEKFPHTKKPDLCKWAESIRLMRERDKRKPEDIADAFIWANNDDIPSSSGFCWSSNIKSPDKLRKHFETIMSQKLSSTKQRVDPYGPNPFI